MSITLKLVSPSLPKALTLKSNHKQECIHKTHVCHLMILVDSANWDTLSRTGSHGQWDKVGWQLQLVQQL